MRLYLDDIRYPCEGWTLVRSVAAAKAAMLAGGVTHASLDHDLGYGCETGCWSETDSGMVTTAKNCGDACRCGCHETGYDFVKWMAETGRWPEHKPTVHSANPVGRANMQAVIDRYWTGAATGRRGG